MVLIEKKRNVHRSEVYVRVFLRKSLSSFPCWGLIGSVVNLASYGAVQNLRVSQWQQEDPMLSKEKSEWHLCLWTFAITLLLAAFNIIIESWWKATIECRTLVRCESRITSRLLLHHTSFHSKLPQRHVVSDEDRF